MKKVTSAVAAFAVVFTAVSPVAGVNAAFSSSLEAANKLASVGVIVDQSANPADYRLGDNITRREMMKIAMQLASSQGVTINTEFQGKFTDVPESDWAWKYAETALDNGFIAANAMFNPSRNVTKAESLKMIMNASGIEKAANDTASWEDDYVEGGVAAGIVESFSDYSMDADRGWIFKASASSLEVAADVSSDDDLLDQLLGGLDDSEDTTDTTDETTENVFPEGDVIEVSLNPESAANGTQIPSTGAILFAKVDFTAGDSDVSVNTVELKSLGLAAVPSSTKIWFEKNGKRLSGKASFSSERMAVTSFAPAYVVKAGATETLDLYVELATDAGNDFQFGGKVTSASTTNVGGSFTTNTLRTATYTVAPSYLNAVGTPTSISQTTELIEIGKFTLANNDTSNETRDLKFQTVTLRQLGTGDFEDLSNIVVERNGVAVSSETMVSGKDVTFVVNDIVKDGTTATYYVKASVVSVQNNAGDSYNLSLRNTSDISVVEVLNGFRSTVTTPSSDVFATYTVTGADITFARDTSVELSKTYAKGSSDVVFMQGTITTKAPITLEDPTLTFTGTGSDLFTTLYLQIGSSTMTWSATATGTAAFSGLATVDGTATVKVYAKLKDTATSVDVKFDDLRLSSFTSNGKVEYVSNQNNVTSSVGSISGVQVTVGTTNLSVTRTDGLGATKVAVGSKNVLVNEVALAVTQGNSVNISNATYTVTASGSYSNNVFATLYVDGTPVSTKTVSGSTVTFNNVSKVVGTSSVKLAVKVDLSDAYSTGDFSMRLTSLDATDSVTSVAVTPTYPTAANLTVASAIGTVSSSDANPKASLILAGSSNQKVLAFRVKATNDAVKLRDVNFTGVALANLSNFRILTPANKEITATSNSGTAVVFSNIADANNYSVAMDTTATFYLIADVNTNVNTVSNLAVTLDGASSKVKASNGTLSTMVGGSIASNTHAIEENTAVVAKATNSSKDLATSALRFTVTASGKDSVTLSGATFDNLFSGYTGSTTLTVYKTSVSSANIVGTGSTTGVVSFTANKTVDSGSTNTYIVVVDGTIDASANSPSWTVRLSDLQVATGGNTVNAKNYLNMGDFPITETK